MSYFIDAQPLTKADYLRFFEEAAKRKPDDRAMLFPCVPATHFQEYMRKLSGEPAPPKPFHPAIRKLLGATA